MRSKEAAQSLCERNGSNLTTGEPPGLGAGAPSHVSVGHSLQTDSAALTASRSGARFEVRFPQLQEHLGAGGSAQFKEPCGEVLHPQESVQ